MEVVKLLAEEAGQNISATNGPLKSPPLHIASRFNHVDIVSYLIGKGASVNQLDLDGATALSDAAAAGSLVRLGFQKAWKKTNNSSVCIKTLGGHQTIGGNRDSFGEPARFQI